jgi:hypothetical protein
MRTSIALSVIILAIGLATGLMHQRQLTTLRQDGEQLATRAAELGVQVESRDPSGRSKLSIRRQGNPGSPTRPVIEQIRAYGRAMEELRLSGEEIGPVLQKQGWEVMERLMDLDPEEVKHVIDSLVAEKPLPEQEQARRSMIELSIRMLAEDHPEAALSLFAASKDLIHELENGGTVIKSSLANWAKKDPAAALTWIQESGENVPAMDRDEMKSSALAGVAQTDPKLAFKLLSEIETDQAYAIRVIAEAAKSPEDRAATLSAFRNHLTTVSDPGERDSLRKKALGGLAESLSGESFASVTKWMSGQKFSSQECDELSRALPEGTTSAETGKWIEWMAGSLPPEKLGERVDLLIAPWAKKDCHAVAKWLGEEPDGSAKTAAISAYARTVAEHEPQSAVQWAMTLPAGEERSKTLKAIYQKWPDSDSAAKAAFAAEHGIPPDPSGGR